MAQLCVHVAGSLTSALEPLWLCMALGERFH